MNNEVEKNQDFKQSFTAETFASFLRRSRMRLQKTMGQMARELGITVVYYSEVEAGKKPAFPDKKVSYATLATTLNIPEELLKNLATFDRDKRTILKSFSCTQDNAHLAVAFGRRLTNNDLSEKQLKKIQKILNEVE